jgi:DNA-binding GntR family transcriptional regulator
MPTALDDKPLLVQTVHESVVDYMRGLILSGRLPPGERLVQSELAEQLGVSRTPVREALHKLAAEGLVTLSSYKGATVADFSILELEEIYTVRCALESHAAYLAAERISEDTLAGLETLLSGMAQAFQGGDMARLLEVHHDFHVTVCTAAGGERLQRLAVQHLELTNVYQRLALSLGRGAIDPVVEHQGILDALRSRDGERAASLVRAHLEATVAELMDLFRAEDPGRA